MKGGFNRKVTHKWSIFQHAMFDCRRVNCLKSLKPQLVGKQLLSPMTKPQHPAPMHRPSGCSGIARGICSVVRARDFDKKGLETQQVQGKLWNTCDDPELLKFLGRIDSIPKNPQHLFLVPGKWRRTWFVRTGSSILSFLNPVQGEGWQTPCPFSSILLIQWIQCIMMWVQQCHKPPIFDGLYHQ